LLISQRINNSPVFRFFSRLFSFTFGFSLPVVSSSSHSPRGSSWSRVVWCVIWVSSLYVLSISVFVSLCCFSTGSCLVLCHNAVLGAFYGRLGCGDSARTFCWWRIIFSWSFLGRAISYVSESHMSLAWLISWLSRYSSLFDPVPDVTSTAKFRYHTMKYRSVAAASKTYQWKRDKRRRFVASLNDAWATASVVSPSLRRDCDICLLRYHSGCVSTNAGPLFSPKTNARRRLWCHIWRFLYCNSAVCTSIIGRYVTQLNAFHIS